MVAVAKGELAADEDMAGLGVAELAGHVDIAGLGNGACAIRPRGSPARKHSAHAPKHAHRTHVENMIAPQVSLPTDADANLFGQAHHSQKVNFRVHRHMRYGEMRVSEAPRR